MKRVAAILCGGLGERFWPATNADFPKYALHFDRSKSFLKATFDRLKLAFPENQIYVVTAEEHRALVRRLLPRLAPSRILAEPHRRNTAGAVTFASLALKKICGPDAVVSFFPADAMIKDEKMFARTVKTCVDHAAATGRITVIGIDPTFPATGYGYIEADKPLGSKWPAGFAVRRFVEKPDLARAKRFLAQKRFVWNAGIFVWKISAFESAMRRHVPDYFKKFQKTFAARSVSRAALARLFKSLPAEPIDRLLMEKMSGLSVFKARFGWDDIGTWDALRRMTPDKEGNALFADGFFDNVQNSVLFCDDGTRIIAAGVKGLIVVKNGKNLLICGIERAQEVGRLKKRLP